MAFTSITLTHQFLNPDGTPASGMVAFRLTERVTNGGVTYAPQVPVHATLDSNGHLSQALPANNDPATAPAGSAYVVTLMLNGRSGEETEVVVPYNASGGTVDLGTLFPSQQGA